MKRFHDSNCRPRVYRQSAARWPPLSRQSAAPCQPSSARPWVRTRSAMLGRSGRAWEAQGTSWSVSLAADAQRRIVHGRPQAPKRAVRPDGMRGMVDQVERFDLRSLDVTEERRQELLRRHAVRRAIFEFIEVFYNRRRLHSTLGHCSPAGYEATMFPRARSAAAA